MIFCLSLLLVCCTSLISAYAITGAKGGIQASGERPSRLNINTLATLGPAFDLYILSLQRLQQQDQSTQLSYYQIAGVHGRPYVDWDGVSGQYPSGYCTHGSILFPIWHRPYLALFEQLLWNNAQDIASSYPVSLRAQYRNAATTLRLPYWDWAQNATMPDVVSVPRLLINTPAGLQNTTNPLYNYTFHPQPSASDFPPGDTLAKYHSTVRCPDANGNSQPARINAQLQANAEVIREMTYSLLTTQPDFAPFSNTGYTDARGNRYNSIENIHNGIHALVGNGGHMGIVPYSGFDPIFWLHHVNVDRIIAIWQALNPSSFVTSEINSYGTFTNRPGLTETETTPLTPFHDVSNTALYTSDSARDTRTFGYTYPELVDWNVTSSSLTSSVRQTVELLYGSGASGSSISRRSSHTFSPPYPFNHTAATDSTHAHSPWEMITDDGNRYYLNIRTSKSALRGSYFIHFFLHAPPLDPGDWGTAPNLIGSQAILYTPSAAHDLGPSSGVDNVTVVGQLPLGPALQRHRYHCPLLKPDPAFSSARNAGNVNRVSPRTVQQQRHYHYHYHNQTAPLPAPTPVPVPVPQFLRANLHWRVQMLADDAPVPLDGPTAHSLRAALRIFVVTCPDRPGLLPAPSPSTDPGEGDAYQVDELQADVLTVLKGVTCGMVGGLQESEGG